MDSDPGKRRRLPAWMLQTGPEHGPRDSGKSHEVCSMLEGQHEDQASAAGSKLRTLSGKRSRNNKNADSESSGNLDITVKRQVAKRRTIKETQNYADPSTSVTTCSAGNTKPQLRTEEDVIATDKKITLKKENRKLKRTKSSDPVVSPQRNENEIDLTVEDLIFIAEEYVNADRMKQQECSSVRESGLESYTSNSSVSPETNMLRPLQSGSCKILMKCTEARSSSDVNYVTNNEMNEKGSQDAENFVKSTTRTGDGAQDMLDLLLGPLLKKPPVEQKPKEAILESLLLTHDNDKQVRKETWKEVSMTKKKSSLKNQVAMLLE